MYFYTSDFDIIDGRGDLGSRITMVEERRIGTSCFSGGAPYLRLIITKQRVTIVKTPKMAERPIAAACPLPIVVLSTGIYTFSVVFI
jgi:hypothetical protein